LGGSFVFGPGDIDRFVHRSETFGDTALSGPCLQHCPEGACRPLWKSLVLSKMPS